MKRTRVVASFLWLAGVVGCAGGGDTGVDTVGGAAGDAVATAESATGDAGATRSDAGTEVDGTADVAAEASADAGSGAGDDAGSEQSSAPPVTPVTGLDRYTDIVWEGEVPTAPAGLSDEFSFEAPAGAVSVAVEVEGQPGAMYVAAYLDREGASKPAIPDLWMFNVGTQGVCTTCRVRVSPTERVYTLFFPNTSVYPYEPGTWTMKIYGMNLTGKSLDWQPVHVRVYAKRAGPPPGRGVLSLHFHFTGAGGLTASNAQTSEAFGKALAGTRAYLAAAGIDVGSVTYDNIPAEYSVIDTFLGSDSDLSRLYALAEGVGAEGIHIYVVQFLAAGSFERGTGLVEGVTSGIPGAVRGDTARAGIAVTATGLLMPWAPGLVLAHEIGHYLGLYHSTERDGSGDNLPDTKTGDASNVMFWAAAYPHATFSPGQSVVMERHPLIAPPDDEAAGVQ